MSVHPSVFPLILPSFCLSGYFLRIGLLVFPEFWHGAKNPCGVVHGRVRFFRKTLSAPSIGEISQKIGQNFFFLYLKKNFVISFQWICAIMKIYIVCCVSAKIRFLGKIFSWDVGQNALNQSRIFKSTISPEQIDEIASFFCMFTQIHRS